MTEKEEIGEKESSGQRTMSPWAMFFGGWGIVMFHLGFWTLASGEWPQQPSLFGWVSIIFIVAMTALFFYSLNREAKKLGYKGIPIR